MSLKLNNVDTSLLIDTGSTVNIIDEETHQKIGKPTLQKIKEPNLYPYGTSNPLRILGQCELLIETKHKIQCHKFFVTKGNHGSLMGYQTAQALNLVKILQNINDPTSTYPNLFKGIGKLKDTQVKITSTCTLPSQRQSCTGNSETFRRRYYWKSSGWSYPVGITHCRCPEERFRVRSYLCRHAKAKSSNTSWKTSNAHRSRAYLRSPRCKSLQ